MAKNRADKSMPAINASATDARAMVMSFRLSELQTLLVHMGKSKVGRKQELLTRTNNAMSKGVKPDVMAKIMELYTTIHATTTARTGSMVYQSKYLATVFKNKAGTKNLKTSQYIPEDIFSSLTQASKAMIPQALYNKLPFHPDVTMKKLPFYDIRDELVKLSSLVPQANTRFQEAVFNFHLTPQQVQDINKSRDYQPGAMILDYNVQVQLRFCLLETSCAQEDNFPPAIVVRVNGKWATLPNPIPSNKAGVEPKRPSRPVNITPICKLSSTSSNQIHISWAADLGRTYCAAVFLVKKNTNEMLLNRLKTNGVRHPDHTRALIKEKLTMDHDNEIATTSLRVSLFCPLGKMRMKIPGRASSCNHLQCFDLATYLMMNEKKPTWSCPVCDNNSEYDNLLVDGLFMEILKKSDVNDLEFFDDGSWKPIHAKDKEKDIVCHNLSTLGDSPSKAEVIGLPDSDEEDNVDVIDLTESDNEVTVEADIETNNLESGLEKSDDEGAESDETIPISSKRKRSKRVLSSDSIDSPPSVTIMDNSSVTIMDNQIQSIDSPPCIDLEDNIRSPLSYEITKTGDSTISLSPSSHGGLPASPQHSPNSHHSSPTNSPPAKRRTLALSNFSDAFDQLISSRPSSVSPITVNIDQQIESDEAECSIVNTELISPSHSNISDTTQKDDEKNNSIEENGHDEDTNVDIENSVTSHSNSNDTNESENIDDTHSNSDTHFHDKDISETLPELDANDISVDIPDPISFEVNDETSQNESQVEDDSVLITSFISGSSSKFNPTINFKSNHNDSSKADTSLDDDSILITSYTSANKSPISPAVSRPMIGGSPPNFKSSDDNDTRLWGHIIYADKSNRANNDSPLNLSPVKSTNLNPLISGFSKSKMDKYSSKLPLPPLPGIPSLEEVQKHLTSNMPPSTSSSFLPPELTNFDFQNFLNSMSSNSTSQSLNNYNHGLYYDYPQISNHTRNNSANNLRSVDSIIDCDAEDLSFNRFDGL